MRYVGLFIILWGSLCVVSCKNDSSSPPEKTAQQLVTEGWQKFSTKDYHGALSSFNQAISTDPSIVDAYNGAGWSNARLSDATNAIVRFNGGATRDANNLEIKAGLAFAWSAQKDYSQSITYAAAVIQADGNWTFSHDASVTVRTLHLLLAENYFAQANYTASLQQVQVLNSSFVADVSTIAGQTALGEEIERLRSVA